MKTIFLISCLLAVVLAFPGDHLPEKRITGGNVAELNAFPYQAGISSDFPDTYMWCGGALISKYFVLTAAHCLDGASFSMVFLGAHNLDKETELGRLEFLVEKESFIIHEEWDADMVINDIALMKLSDPVIISKYIQTINLPNRSFGPVEGQKAIISGWGAYTDAIKTVSTVLRYVDVDMVPISVCQKKYKHFVTESNICISGAHGKSTCEGDSGGPLVMKNSKGENVVIGLASFGADEGCQKQQPAVLVRVTSHLDWISKQTGIEILP